MSSVLSSLQNENVRAMFKFQEKNIRESNPAEL
jgi:hypothetical protein